MTVVGDGVKIQPWQTLADGQFCSRHFALPVLTKVDNKVVLCRIDPSLIFHCEVLPLCLSKMFLQLPAEKFLQCESSYTHTWKQWLSSEQSVLVKVGHSLPGPPFFFCFSCHHCSHRSVYHQLWSVGVTVEEWISLTREWLVFFCMLVNPPDTTRSLLYFCSVWM